CPKNSGPRAASGPPACSAAGEALRATRHPGRGRADPALKQLRRDDRARARLLADDLALTLAGRDHLVAARGDVGIVGDDLARGDREAAVALGLRLGQALAAGAQDHRPIRPADALGPRR